MKEKILALCKARKGLSFSELTRLLPETNGGFGHGVITEYGNILFWAGLSNECIDALLDLKEEGKIEYDPTPAFTYLLDGDYLDLPVMDKVPKKKFKGEKWLPVVINLKQA